MPITAAFLVARLQSEPIKRSQQISPLLLQLDNFSSPPVFHPGMCNLQFQDEHRRDATHSLGAGGPLPRPRRPQRRPARPCLTFLGPNGFVCSFLSHPEVVGPGFLPGKSRAQEGAVTRSWDVPLLGAGSEGERGQHSLPMPAAAPPRDAGATKSLGNPQHMHPWVSRCHPSHGPRAGTSPLPPLTRGSRAGAVPGVCRWRRGREGRKPHTPPTPSCCYEWKKGDLGDFFQEEMERM